METPTEIAISLSDRYRVRPNQQAIQTSWTATGMAPQDNQNPSRPGQEMLKNCIDAINNNGDLIPVTPCSYSFPNPPAPCP